MRERSGPGGAEALLRGGGTRYYYVLGWWLDTGTGTGIGTGTGVVRQASGGAPIPSNMDGRMGRGDATSWLQCVEKGMIRGPSAAQQLSSSAGGRLSSRGPPGQERPGSDSMGGESKQKEASITLSRIVPRAS